MPTNAEAFFRSLATAADIEQLIGTAEDLYFDAKALSNESFAASSNQGTLAKAISAFANADGGVIVYGLEAKKDAQGRDVVQAAKPLADPALVQSKILGLVGQILQPPVEGILVETRVGPENRGYVLVLVPPSDSIPHRVKSGHEYYRRHGSTSLPMEHYELEEIFGRRRRPVLELYYRIVRRIGNVADGYYAMIAIGLRNTGRGIARFPGLFLENVKAFPPGFDGSGNVGLAPLPTSDFRNLLHGANNDRAIYPGMELDVVALQHRLDITRVQGTSQIVDVSCSDLLTRYEIYSEDMPTVRGDLRISTEEIRKEINKHG